MCMNLKYNNKYLFFFINWVSPLHNIFISYNNIIKMNNKTIPTFEKAVSGMFVQSTYKNFVVGYYSDHEKVYHGFLYDFTKNEFEVIDHANAGNSENQGTFAFGMHNNKIVGAYTSCDNIDFGFSYNILSRKWATISASQASNNPDPSRWTPDEHNNVSHIGKKPILNTGTVIYQIYGRDMVGYYVDMKGMIHGFIYDGKNFIIVDNSNAGTNGVQGTFLVDIYEGNVIGGYITECNCEKAFYRDTDGKYTDIKYPNEHCLTSYANSVYKNTVVGYFNDENNIGFLYDLGNKSYTTFEYPKSEQTVITDIYRNKISGYYNKFGSVFGFETEFTI